MKRTCEIKVRFYKRELQELDKKVRKTGMSREGYIRSIAENMRPVEIPPAPYYDLLRELRAVGNNMNQLAYKAHSLGFVDAPMYRKHADVMIALADKMTAVCLPVQSDERRKLQRGDN